MGVKSLLVASVLAFASLSPAPVQANNLIPALGMTTLTTSASSTMTPTVSTEIPLSILPTDKATKEALAEGIDPARLTFLDCRKCTLGNERHLPYNPLLPVPAHHCPRDAITALAKWRVRCNRGQLIPPPECWTKAPSIDRCCGKWVEKDDPKWSNYASAKERVEVKDPETGHGHWEWIAREKDDERRIVMPGWHEYKSDDSVCRQWRTENEAQFAYFMQNLPAFGVEDVDETGRVLNTDTERYNAEGGAYPGQPGYLEN